MAYLEQSTRYISTTRAAAQAGTSFRRRRWRAQLACGRRHLDPASTPTHARAAQEHWAHAGTRSTSRSEGVYKRTIQAKALDTVRGLLPAATQSNVASTERPGVRSAAAADAASIRSPKCADYGSSCSELRKVIPSFLTRVNRPDRGGAWTPTSPRPADDTSNLSCRGSLREKSPSPPQHSMALLDWDPEGEDKVLAAICYPHTMFPEGRLLDRGCAGCPPTMAARSCTRTSVTAPIAGGEHPGHAFERTNYRFDILGDYGTYVDLQRRRMLAIEWQSLSTPEHGFSITEPVSGSGDSRALRRHDGTLGRALRRHCGTFSRPGRVCSVARVPDAVHDADERARGDASLRVAQLTTGASELSPRCTGDAPVDTRRRPGTTRSRPRCATSTTATASSNDSTPNAPRKPVASCAAESNREAQRPRAASNRGASFANSGTYTSAFRGIFRMGLTCTDARRRWSWLRAAA